MPCADNNFISVTMLLVTLSVSHKLHMIAHAHPGLECGWAYVILGRSSYTPNCPTWSQVLGPLHANSSFPQEPGMSWNVPKLGVVISLSKRFSVPLQSY